MSNRKSRDPTILDKRSAIWKLGTPSTNGVRVRNADTSRTLGENASAPRSVRSSLAFLFLCLLPPRAGTHSPRRASVLAYISSLLLRTLPALDNDPYPNAGEEADEPSDLEGSGESLDSSANPGSDTPPASAPAPASPSSSPQRQPLPDTVEGFLAA